MGKVSGKSRMGEIPRITHQIWLQGWDRLPTKFHTNVELLQSKNTNYKHMKWDERSLRQECEKLGVAKKFDSFPYLMQKVELGRYVILYTYGGISVDTDMKTLASIDSTPYIDMADCIVSRAAFPLNIMGHTNNAILLVRPQHPLLLNIITQISKSTAVEEDFMTKELYINGTTGPSFVDGIIQKYKDSIVLIDNKYYEPCFSVDPICRTQADTIMDHQHELSWIHPMFHILFKILFILLYLTPVILGYVVYRNRRAIFRSR